MPIETNFWFDHEKGSAISAFAQVDLLGLLRGFIGNGSARNWVGTGFNLIWRPNHGTQFGDKDFFLELNRTTEELSFKDLTGPNGIANRGFLQDDVFLGGIAYTQEIRDKFDNSGQHFEPGVWINVPKTTGPAEDASVTRMGTIPHGTTINLQGQAFTASQPIFDKASITPFQIGSNDDASTNLVHFDEEDFDKPSDSRTPLANVADLTKDRLSNPNLFLSDTIKGQTILSTTVIRTASDVKLIGSKPDVGGGTDNIAFLQGTPASGPNANAPIVTATFWIERIRDASGKEFDQIQYTQRVLLNFNGLSWPHITVATLLGQ